MIEINTFYDVYAVNTLTSEKTVLDGFKNNDRPCRNSIEILAYRFKSYAFYLKNV